MSKIHSASVEAFIDYLKLSKSIDLNVLIKRMYYNIGWPVDTIIYVMNRLHELGYYPAINIENLRKIIR